MRRLIALIFSLIFIILLPSLFYLQAVKAHVFNAQFYKDELVKYNVYQKIIDESIYQVVDLDKYSLIKEIPFFDKNDLTDVMRSLIIPSWIQGQVESVIDQLFAWMQSNKNIRDTGIFVSLGSFKNKASSIITTKVEEKFNLLPPCAEGQSVSFQAGWQSCRPANLSLEELFSQLNINSIINKIPEQVDLVSLAVNSHNTQEKNNITGILDAIDKFHQMTLLVFSLTGWLYLLAVILFILIIILVARSARSFLRWTGINLFLPGVIMIVSLLWLNNFVQKRINNIPSLTGFFASFTDIFKNVILDLSREVIGRLRVEGIIVLVIGVFFIILSFIIKKKAVVVAPTATPKSKPITLSEKMRR